MCIYVYTYLYIYNYIYIYIYIYGIKSDSIKRCKYEKHLNIKPSSKPLNC